MVSDGLELLQSTDAEGNVGPQLTQKPSEGRASVRSREGEMGAVVQLSGRTRGLRVRLVRVVRRWIGRILL